MKKFFLIVVISSSLFAGRTFISENTIHEYRCQLLQLRTQLGYDLPPEEEIEYEELSFVEKARLFRKFNSLWMEFQKNKKQLRNLYNDSDAKKKFYDEFIKEFVRDKNRYEAAMKKELGNHSQNPINSSLFDGMPELENYNSSDEKEA